MYYYIDEIIQLLCKKKKIPPPQPGGVPSEPPPGCANFDILHIKKNVNENYVEFDFRMGTVLEIFFIFMNE